MAKNKEFMWFFKKRIGGSGLDLCKSNSVVLEDDDTGENPNVRLLDHMKKKEATDGAN